MRRECGGPARACSSAASRATTAAPTKQSTGLGLWLVARLAQKMGVSVAVDSAEDEFFSVTFGFPANKMHYFEG